MKNRRVYILRTVGHNPNKSKSNNGDVKAEEVYTKEMKRKSDEESTETPDASVKNGTIEENVEVSQNTV